MITADKENKILEHTKKGLEKIFETYNIVNTPESAKLIDDIFNEIKNYKKSALSFENNKKQLQAMNNIGINIAFEGTEKKGWFVDKDVVIEVKKETKQVLSSNKKKEFEELVINKLGPKPVFNPNSLDSQHYNLKRSDLYKNYIKDHGRQRIVLTREERIKFEALAEEKIGKNTSDRSSEIYIEKRAKLYEEYVNSDAVGKKIYKPITVEEINEKIKQKGIQDGKQYNINFNPEKDIDVRIFSTVNKVYELTKSDPKIEKITPQIANLVHNYALASYPNEAPALNKTLIKELAKNSKEYSPIKNYKEQSKEINEKISHEYNKLNNSLIEPKLDVIKKFIDQDLAKTLNEKEIETVKRVFNKIVEIPYQTTAGDQKFVEALKGIEKFKQYCNQQAITADKEYNALDRKDIFIAKIGLKAASNVIKLQLKKNKNISKDYQSYKSLLETLPVKENNFKALSTALEKIKQEVTTSKNEVHKKINDPINSEVELILHTKDRNAYQAYMNNNERYFKDEIDKISGIKAYEVKQNIEAQANNPSTAKKQNPRLATLKKAVSPKNNEIPNDIQQKPIHSSSALVNDKETAPQPEFMKAFRMQSSARAMTDLGSHRALPPQSEFTKVKPTQNKVLSTITIGSQRVSSSTPAKPNLPDEVPPSISPKLISKENEYSFSTQPTAAQDLKQNNNAPKKPRGLKAFRNKIKNIVKPSKNNDAAVERGQAKRSGFLKPTTGMERK